MSKPLDSTKWQAEYSAHLDRWLEGKEALMSPGEFIARKLAEALVEQYLAEQGILYA